MKVADIMDRDVVTATPDDDVESLIKLPVVDDDGRLVGVVTCVDCLAALSGEE